MEKLSLLWRHPEFVILIAANVVLGMAYSFVLPFASLFGTRALGLSPIGFGLFMTANALLGIGFSVRLARWSDTRYSRKTVLLLGGTAGALGYVAYGLIREPWTLLAVGSLALGISSVAFSQTFALARDLLTRRGVPEADMPLYINVFRLCYALSWTVGPALGARLLAHWSFRGTYLAAAGLFLAFTLIVALGVEAYPPSEKSKRAAAAMPLSKAIRLPGFLSHFIAFILILSCSSMGMMNLPLLILNVLGGTESQVGLTYSLPPIFELPFMYYAGVLAARIPTSRIIRWAAWLAILYYAGLASARSPWQVLILQLLSAAMVAVNSGLAITFFQDFLPGQAGTATNLYSAAARIGSTGGYLLFGVLGSAFGYRSVFWVCAGFCALASAIMLRRRPVAAEIGAGA
jgi:SET family sugar efflux transporter-like MFS transporter